jgi:hypothetical protein
MPSQFSVTTWPACVTEGETDDPRAAVARHPDDGIVDAGVHLGAEPVFQEESVEVE